MARVVRKHSPARCNSVAVLPFSWLTVEGSDSSLSIGMADAVITRLSNLPQLVVRPTNAVLRYVNSAQDPTIIAKELGVDFVISGSIQQAGERVRVTVQLLSPDQQRLWMGRLLLTRSSRTCLPSKIPSPNAWWRPSL